MGADGRVSWSSAEQAVLSAASSVRGLCDGPRPASGPKVACVRIPFARGVCGACARTREVQLVEDVHAFPGHIACDSASSSELVLPLLAGDRLVAVFDLDSPLAARFDAVDASGFAQAVGVLAAGTDWP